MVRHRNYDEYHDETLFPFKYALPIRTMVGAGLLLGAYLPKKYSVAIGVAMIGGTVATAIASRLGLYTDSLTKSVVRGRKMAKIDGDFVVFHIGARPNRHIDGFMKWMGDAMGEMLKELEHCPELGCLGGESFVGPTGTLLVQYWRSLEELNAYARNSTNKHSSPWAKLMKKGRESPDYGFWHESFLVKDGNYESIYVNCPPLMLGNCHAADLVQIEGANTSAAGRAGKSDGSDYPEHLGKPDY